MGTPRLLTDRFGRVVKKLLHDSFGVLLDDSFPDLSLPVGFAGGLVDADTGLVRFGWRDYDPKIGRFTAPDPANDRRGDGDIYDYCVDDPVSRVDATGLAWKLPEKDEYEQEEEEEEEEETLPPLSLSDLIKGAATGAVKTGARGYYTSPTQYKIPAAIAGGTVGAASGMFEKILEETPVGKQVRRYLKKHRRRAESYWEDDE